MTSELIVTCSLAGLGILAAAEGGEGQEWTAMALLAAVVLGIGAKMVMSVDKNTAAVQNLVVELRSRNELDRSRDSALDKMAEGIARLLHLNGSSGES